MWNRACDPFAPFTHPGDAALAALLLCHGMAMNGGLLHAVEGLEPDQRERAVAGYRLLGLDAAADAVEDVARQAPALDEGDETIDRAFREHLRRHPEQYAPLGDRAPSSAAAALRETGPVVRGGGEL